MRILVINCGSSSIKYQLFEMPAGEVIAGGIVERIGGPSGAHLHEAGGREWRREVGPVDHGRAVQQVLRALVDNEWGALESLTEVDAVGHRVVHGAEAFTGSVVIDDAVERAIERAADLAPLHNPPNLTGIRATRRELPGVPQVACFDTAFHATIPEVAYTYALPHELYEEHGVRRYGFHGISHRYVAHRAAEALAKPEQDVNCITCHLGNGCSMTAVQGGRSIDTSMGLTPLEGLVMGTRCGDLDPGVLFFLASKGYGVDALNALCNKESGLLGVSGESNDMRTLLRAAGDGYRRAQLAIDLFAYRIKKYLGAYAAVLGRLDAIAFTGGIGENSPEIRAASCAGLEQLGVSVDPNQNAAARGDVSEIQTGDSRVRVLVIATDEEAAIAADTYALTTPKT